VDNQTREKYARAQAVALGASAVLLLALLLTLFLLVAPKPGKIRRLHKDILTLQEKLISAQITTQQMDNVHTLIEKNLALSAQDTLARGASLSFLKDLTAVFDMLKINLVSLEPAKTLSKNGHIETPYRMEIICNYHQLCQLINKMEKSPRLISIRGLKVENYFDEYFREDKTAPDQCTAGLELTTLTLIKGAL
jgi:Tfp pilus assembly protein PilO